MRVLLVTVSLASLAACAADAPSPGSAAAPPGTSADSLETGGPGNPEVPSILRDVAIFAGGARVAPAIGPFNTTNDGRLSLGAGSELATVVPEALTTHFLDASPGTPLRGPTFAYAGPLYDEAATGPVERRARTICDGTKGPRACGADDCYDVTIVSVVVANEGTAERWVQLWGAPVTVRVAEPKTARARVSSVVANGTLTGGKRYPTDRLFEPNFTSDGHLFVARVGGQLKDRDMTPGGKNVGIDIIYAVHDDGVAPCDPSGWDFKNITRAPDDERVRSRYGFARYPFRDTEGNRIAAGDDLGGSYPWIDREGRNLFFKSAARPLYFNDASGAPTSTFPARCVSGVACDASAANGVLTEAKADLRGTSVLGLWTHGRQVMLDGRSNNVDFGLGTHDTRQREVKLYGAASKPNVGWVRVGAGRQFDGPGPAEPGGNASTINSLESRFTHLTQMTPKTVRDVVWTINTQNTSEEVAFDDWIDPHALIVSDMMPSLTHDDPVTHRPAYRDGFALGAGYGAEGAVVRMQNAATALDSELRVPSFGALEGGGRAEPVALGGITGRGLWLTGKNRLVYDVPAQPKALGGAWFTSLFLDARFADDDDERRVVTFPDGSFVALQGHDALALYDSPEHALATVPLPGDLAVRGGWHHLGFGRDASRLRVFVDGFVLREIALPSARAFGFEPGQFTVGKLEGDRKRAGVRGWFDEVRVFNEEVSAELACNHAHGTLVGVGAKAPAELRALADLYPPSSHAAIGAAVPKGSRRPTYACLHDYSADYEVSLASLPAGTTSLRQTLLQPATLHFDQPRPDESTNAFCLTCHEDGAGRAPSLSLAALVAKPDLTMANDPRRQPMQPPPLVFGNIPAGYAGGLPASAVKAPRAGLPIDAWLSP